MKKIYGQWGKSFGDKVFAIVVLPFVLPIMLLICLMILFTGLYPIFIHIRPGYHKHPIKVFKFRTMRNQEVTKFGRILRQTSLDELPQLFNVIIGNMSIVGPRPLLKEHLSDPIIGRHARFDVKPGITGLAQVKGRNRLSLAEKLVFDSFYVKKMSLKLDLYVLLRTFKQLLKISEADFHRQKVHSI